MPIDLNKHKEAFLIEARNHIDTMNKALIKLEKTPSKKSFSDLFRSIHTLKSLAATMGYNQSMSVCHEIENLLDEIREKKISIKNYAEILFHSFDYLSSDMTSIADHNKELSASGLIEQIKNLLRFGNDHVISLPDTYVTNTNDAIEKIKSIEVKVDRLDILMYIAQELLVTKMKFESIQQPVDYSELTSNVESLGRLISDLQYHVMQVRLVPVMFIFNRFYRLIRDLAKKQQKEINLEVEGGDIELDRSLIDEISESISHLIRNAIDHGIEHPEIRIKKNKPPQGTIMLKASRSKETVIIEIHDDGKGLDMPAIRNAAMNNQIIQADETIENEYDIIFSGISTRNVATTVSGRGLGLSIVKQKIASIGGTIRVESTPDKGAVFYIELPLTLAIINSLFVRVRDEIYAIPIEDVERLIMVSPEDFQGLFNHEAIIFEDHNIPIIRLSELFKRPTQTNLKKQPIVIVRKGNKYLGLAVDSLDTTQEIIIKPLSRSIRENKYFSGAAMIGSGRMVLILDIAYIMRTKHREVAESTK